MIKALVIDDEKAFTDIAAGFLAGFCDVTTSNTAEEGLAQFQLLLPDIVLVDNQLPGLSGIDLIKKMRAVHEAYIVMVTIDKQEDVSMLLKPLAVDAFLKKPFRRADLESVLLAAMMVLKRKKGLSL